MNYGASTARRADKRKGGDFKNAEVPPLGGYPFFKYTLAQRTCVGRAG